MKKLALTALVAAAAAAPAFAQSSMQIYGRLNVTAESERVQDGDREMNVRDNASRIGFKGTEDLGGGLKAGFIIEHGFNADTGTAASTAFWNRQSEVFLGGSFGTVRLGSFVPESYFATADYISMHNHDTGTSADAFYASTFKMANKVGYASPVMGGFQFHASVAEGNATTEKTYDLAANYDAGALHLGAGFEKQGEFKQFAVRALYEAGPVTVGAYVQRVSELTKTLGTGATVNLGSGTGFRVSAMYTMGNNEFHLNVGNAPEYDNLDRSDALQATLAYNYNLSKRTKLQAFVTRIDRDDVLLVYGGDYDSVGVGIRHNF